MTIKNNLPDRRFQAKHLVTHNLSKHPLFRIWSHMKSRCISKNTEDYSRYGGRGIKVCDEWLEDFQKFYDWAIANGWQKGLTIDRFPNNDGNYEPTNCRWADACLQANNRSTNRICTAFGVTDTFANLVRKFSTLNLVRVYERYNKQGWDLEDALTVPIDPRNRKSNRWVTVHGETMILRDAIQKFAICSEAAAYHRVSSGWDIEKALSTPNRR